MRMNLVTLRSELISGALDSLTLGVIVVAQAGRKIWHNRRAEEIASDPEIPPFFPVLDSSEEMLRARNPYKN